MLQLLQYAAATDQYSTIPWETLVQEGCQPYTSLNSVITNQNIIKIIKASRIKFISEGNELLKWGSTLVRNDQLITVACRGVVWYCQQVRQLWMNELGHLPSGNTQVDITVPLEVREN